MQPPCAVDRARVRHLARHLEVSLNLLTIIDILNEIPNRVLQYLRKHFNLEISRSSQNKDRKVETGVHNCRCSNHLDFARGQPRTQIDLDYEDDNINHWHYFKSSLFALTFVTVLTKSLKILGLQSEIVVCMGRWKNICKTDNVSPRTQIHLSPITAASISNESP